VPPFDVDPVDPLLVEDIELPNPVLRVLPDVPVLKLPLPHAELGLLGN
jgi:hypothetical protein